MAFSKIFRAVMVWVAVSACLVAILAMAGCGKVDDTVVDTRDILAGPLENGVLLYRDDSGDLVLAHEMRDLLVLPGDVGPVIRQFEESSESLFGMFRFVRTGETKFPTVPVTVESAPGLDGYHGDVIAIRYSDQAGTVTATLYVEGFDQEMSRLHLVPGGTAGQSLAFPVRCGDRDTFHGFGEQYNGIDQRGQVFELMVSEQGIGREDAGPDNPMWWMTGDPHTTYFPMPYFINMATGSGLLLESGWRTKADLCSTDAAVAWFESMAWRTVNMRLFHGPAPMDVIRQLGDVVGRPAAPPDWAYRTWLCTQGGPDAVLERVGKAETIGIPFGVLWIQDWTGPRTNIGGGSGVQYRWQHDPEHYPDLAGLVAGLHQKDYRVLAYVNPFVQENLPNHYEFMSNSGMLASDPGTGETYVLTSPAGDAGAPDFTMTATEEYVQGQLAAIVTDSGFDGWMADFGEYFPLDAAISDGGDPAVYHNLYPVEWARQSRAVMDMVNSGELGDGPADRGFVYFSRSGFTGVQGVSQIHWVGDQEATFSETDGMPTVVTAMLNLGLSGQPFVTHDIAGFSGGPSSKELYLRWTELGAFTPFMRTHDGNNRDNNWCWDRDYFTGEHFRRMAVIHDVLVRDFFKPLAVEAAQTGAPIIRPLMLEFPDDETTWSIDDQFMIGDNLLVAPILTAQDPGGPEMVDFENSTTVRDFYLPEGDWYYVWPDFEYAILYRGDDPRWRSGGLIKREPVLGQPIVGPTTVTINAPIGRPPAFHRGSPYDALLDL